MRDVLRPCTICGEEQSIQSNLHNFDTLNVEVIIHYELCLDQCHTNQKPLGAPAP